MTPADTTWVSCLFAKHTHKQTKTHTQIKKQPDTGSQMWQIYRWSWISSCLSRRDIHHVIKRGKLRAFETLPADLLTSDKSNLSLQISTDATVKLSDKMLFFPPRHNWGKQTVPFLINSCMLYYISFYKTWEYLKKVQNRKKQKENKSSHMRSLNKQILSSRFFDKLQLLNYSIRFSVHTLNIENF